MTKEELELLKKEAGKTRLSTIFSAWTHRTAREKPRAEPGVEGVKRLNANKKSSSELSLQRMTLDEIEEIRISAPKNSGMTQEEFGKSLNIAKSTYNNYETGIRDPKSDFWIAVAQKYGVTIDYLMGFSDDPHKKSDDTKNSPSTTEAAPGEELRQEIIHLVGKRSVRLFRVLFHDDDQIIRHGFQNIQPLFFCRHPGSLLSLGMVI